MRPSEPPSASQSEIGVLAQDARQRLQTPRPVPWHKTVWFEILQFTLLSAILLWLIVRGALSMGYAWQWEKVPRYLYRVIDGEVIFGPLLKGVGVTLNISWIAMLLTVAIGLLVAMLRLSHSVVGRAVAAAYIEIIRNTPFLVQLFIIFSAACKDAHFDCP